MSIQRTPHDWSKDSLFAKAQRYTEEMLSRDQSDWRFGFWSALALEMLVRASIAHISPALLADGKDWNNVLFAVGREPNQKKFNPKSADINLLLANVENAFPAFTKEMLNFSVTHINKRNSELHSGALPFDDVGTSSWLPMYYAVCECLLGEMDETLESLLGDDAAREARDHIQALKDDAAKSVKQNINAHKTLWEEKTLMKRPNWRVRRRILPQDTLDTEFHVLHVTAPLYCTEALLEPQENRWMRTVSWKSRPCCRQALSVWHVG